MSQRLESVPEQFVDSFAEKLILLERKTGASVSYRLLPPLHQSLHDFVEIQAAAKNIAEFVGLT
ncbi:MAG: hypothetical protein ACRD2L_00830, partial [Terriglobia bacterium]